VVVETAFTDGHDLRTPEQLLDTADSTGRVVRVHPSRRPHFGAGRGDGDGRLGRRDVGGHIDEDGDTGRHGRVDHRVVAAVGRQVAVVIDPGAHSGEGLNSR
jgi:hypothetical protein